MITSRVSNDFATAYRGMDRTGEPTGHRLEDDWCAPGPPSVEWTSWQALSEALAEWRRVSSWSYWLWPVQQTAQRMRHDEILRGDD